MKILIIGYGVSGKAASAFLKNLGNEVIAVDRKAEEALPDSPDFPLEGFSLVVVSPGIPLNHPLVVRAKREKIEVIGEIELGLRYLQNRVFAITGSNGKTTTVLLAQHILNACGKKAQALGNVGKSLTGYLSEIDPEEILILELSSFQLQTLEAKKIEVGLVLNISPNHLDYHKDLDEYARAKARMQDCLIERGELFVSEQVKREFGSLFPNGKIFEKNLDSLASLSYTELMMPSKQSVQAAYLLCKRCGVTDSEFLQSLKSYRKPPHRIEWVAKIDDVSYYDDSKSSNVQSVIHAVSRVEGSIILIVGGVHKGSSYKPWIEAFKGKVRVMIAYGKAAPMIECELARDFDVRVVEKFGSAVQMAKEEGMAGESVLLSPGCSSYDQFDNYQQRGEEFKRLVRNV